MSTLIQPVQSAGSAGRTQPQVSRGSTAWTVFLWWILATCAVSLVLTLPAFWLIYGARVDGERVGWEYLPPGPATAFIATPFLSVAGLIVGQFLALRRYAPDVSRGKWIGVSTIGWIISAFLMFCANVFWAVNYTRSSSEFGYPHEVIDAAESGWGAAAAYAQSALLWGFVFGAIGGLFVGLCQAALLRGYVPAFTWVVACILGLGLGGAVGMYIFGVLDIMTSEILGLSHVMTSVPEDVGYLRAALSMALPTPASLLVVGIVTGATLAWRSRRSGGTLTSSAGEA